MHRKLLTISFILLFALACKKENEHPQWDIEALGPVLNASLDIHNIIADSLHTEDTDGAVRIVYDQNIYGMQLDSVYQIPDTTIPSFYVWPFPSSTIQPNTSFSPGNSNVLLGINSVKLTRAIIRSGTIRIEVKNTLPSKIIFTYTIPRARHNGNPFRVTQEVAAGSVSTPTLYSGDYDFSGYAVDLTGVTGTLFNTISYNVLTVSDPAGSPFPVNPGDTLINLKSTLVSIQPSYAKGYLGQSTIHETSSQNTGIGGLIRSGSVRLDSITMDLDFENNIGADIRSIFNSFVSENTHTGTVIPLNAPSLLGYSMNINRAIETNDPTNPIRPSAMHFHLDKQNSNLLPFFENLPDKINYDIDIAFNPLGNISGYNDFVYSDYLVNGKLKLTMPLRFGANNILLTDTQNLSLNSLTNLDPIGPATFTLFAENGFPLDLHLQLFLLDSMGTVTDSLLLPDFIARAQTDANYKVTVPVMTRLPIPVDEVRKQRILSTRRMAIRARFSTPDYPQIVQFYSSYKLNLRLVADGVYSIR